MSQERLDMLYDFIHFKEKLEPQIVPVLKKYKITKAAVFGSYARGEASDESDIDLLVTIAAHENRDIDFFDMWDELELKIQKPISLLSEENLMYAPPLFKQSILEGSIWFYEI